MKKIICLVLATIVFSSMVLTGCGSKNESSSTGSATTEGSTTATTATSATDFKKDKVKVLLSYHGDMEKFSSGKSLNNNELADQLRKISGMDVAFENLPKDEPHQKLSLLLAAGEAGDLVALGSDRTFLYRYASHGVFAPLDELQSMYSPDYLTNVPERNRLVGKYNGKTYAYIVPSTVKYQDAMVYRKDIFDKYGIKVPTNTDELYDTLKTIKEKANVIPFGTDSSLNNNLYIAGAFGVDTIFIVKNSKLEFACTQPEYKEYLTFIKKLFDEQLLDKEFSTNKNGASRDKLSAGTIAMTTLAWWDIKTVAEAMDKKADGGKLDYIAPIKGKDGKAGRPEPTNIVGIYAIPTNSKVKEAAAIFYNSFYMGSDYSTMQMYGVEGISYSKSGSEIKFDQEKYNQSFPYAAVYNSLYTSDEAYSFRLASRGFKPYYDKVEENSKHNLNYSLYMPDIEEYSKINKALGDHVSENTIKFIIGARALTEFDKFVEEFNAKGGQAAIDAINTKWFETEGKNIK